MKNVAPPAIMYEFHLGFKGTIDRSSMMNSFLPGFHAGGKILMSQTTNHPARTEANMSIKAVYFMP